MEPQICRMRVFKGFGVGVYSSSSLLDALYAGVIAPSKAALEEETLSWTWHYIVFHLPHLS